MSTPTEDGHVRLSSIADDILRKTLTFLTPADCTRGPAAASKFMRVVASTANRQRYVDNYVLRGDKHGVVHALATALGTRRWPIARPSPTRPKGRATRGRGKVGLVLAHRLRAPRPALRHAPRRHATPGPERRAALYAVLGLLAGRVQRQVRRGPARRRRGVRDAPRSGPARRPAAEVAPLAMGH